MKVISDTMAEFLTPSNTAGFGTEGYLRPSAEPISGIALLDQSSPYGPNFVTLRIRLNAAASRLKSALLRLNRDCMQEGRGYNLAYRDTSGNYREALALQVPLAVVDSRFSSAKVKNRRAI